MVFTPASMAARLTFSDRTPEPQWNTMRLSDWPGSASALKKAMGISSAPSMCSNMYSCGVRTSIRTISPFCMTATRSHIWPMTPRSWLTIR